MIIWIEGNGLSEILNGSIPILVLECLVSFSLELVSFLNVVHQRFIIKFDPLTRFSSKIF